MASCASKAFCFLVHKLCKGLSGAAYMTGESICTFIGRSQHQGVQAVTDRKNITFINSCSAAACFHIVNVIMGKGHFLIQTAVLQYDQGSKDLCDTGRIIRLVRVFSKKNRSGLRFHKDAAVCFYRDGRRPGRRGQSGSYTCKEYEINTEDQKNDPFSKIHRIHRFLIFHIR